MKQQNSDVETNDNGGDEPYAVEESESDQSTMTQSFSVDSRVRHFKGTGVKLEDLTGSKGKRHEGTA